MHSFRSTNWSWWCLLRRVLQHWTRSAAGAGRPVVVEVVDATGCAALLVGRWDSLLRESWSVHLLHGRGASVVAQGNVLGGAADRCAALRAASCELLRRAARGGWHRIRLQHLSSQGQRALLRSGGECRVRVAM